MSKFSCCLSRFFSLSLMLLACAAMAQTRTLAAPTAATPATTSKPTATLTVTPSSSTSTTTTATKKANTGEIFRWVDKNGKVQYSADVPEDRRSTARKVDTRSNIVSSRVPASVQGAPQPPSNSQEQQGPDARGTTSGADRRGSTEREKCEAAWQAYRAAEQCFAQYRQSTAGGAGNKAGSRVSAEALEKCPSLTEPAACR